MLLGSPQIDVSVNAPMSGKIVEFLVNEEDTVAVGQDLLRIEPGEGGEPAKDDAPKAKPAGGARSEPKSPEEGNKDEAAPAAQKEKNAPEDTHKKQEEKAPKLEKSSEEKPAPKKEEKPAPKPQPKEEGSGAKSIGTRNETRVGASEADLR